MTIEEAPNEDLVTYPGRIQALIDTCTRQGWNNLIKGFNSMMDRTYKEISKRNLAV